MNKELSIINFNDEQVALIKAQIAKDCNNSELELFLYQCRKTGLDPLTRQIYAIKRGGKMTIQTSIDGFRVIAERSGSYAGQDEPIWQDDEKGFPTKCTVKVYRFTPNFEQRYCAGVGVAHFKEYYPNPYNLQKSMPHAMIAKVAEALALRKAFPQDLSGLYTGDEMAQAEVIVNPEEEPKTPQQKTDEGNFEDWGKTEDGKKWCDDKFKLLKENIELCKNPSELKIIWTNNSVTVNRLKKYDKVRYEKIIDAKDGMKLMFEAESEEPNGSLVDDKIIDYSQAG